MRIHLIGIGGVGMAGLAFLLKARGHEVTGCDLGASARTRWLEDSGIAVASGHEAAHLDGTDSVVVTPAVAADNPELAFALSRAIPVRRRGEVLAELVGEAADSIAVAGSHGKTTTATFIARLLLALGEDVEWAIGGETGGFPVAGRRGLRPVMVVEADESDGTLAGYRVRTLVITNCEYDHPDHFPTREDYLACFAAARSRALSTIELADLEPSLFERPEFGFLRALPEHNRLNALMAVEVARRRGHALPAIAAALPAIVSELPDRRFERLGPGVYTDYAHHPTELKCAIRMARAVCRGRLRVLFQPHRHTRTRALLGDFPAALALADEVVLLPVYAAFEPPVEGGDIADLYVECRRAGIRVLLARSCEEGWEHARNSMTEGDVTLLLGAGDLIRLAGEVRRWAAAGGLAAPPLPKRRLLIGQGTNTWRSDLNLVVEYVRTGGPADRPGASLGIPWMAGVPGTVGGWVKMNAGAFGHSISELVRRVKVSGRWRTREECGFGYRTSAIDGEIEEVEFEPLDFGGERQEDYLRRRPQFPPGTKGSVFRNPPGDYAGRLLEAAGAKALEVGGARVWEKHANVIVAGEGATASDFLALSRLMRLKVHFRFGVELEPEVVGLKVD